jgi:general secretion pathway protein G
VRKLLPNGFTLIELMVVISIIAILASAGLVMYENAQSSARDGRRVADLNQIANALETYYSNNSGYAIPSSCTGVTAGSSCTADLNSTNFNSFTSYFSNNTLPSDPGSNTYKYYACMGQNQLASTYIMCVALENCGSRCNYSHSTNSDPDACNPPVQFTAATGNDWYCKTVKK